MYLLAATPGTSKEGGNGMINPPPPIHNFNFQFLPIPPNKKAWTPLGYASRGLKEKKVGEVDTSLSLSKSLGGGGKLP